MHATDPSGEDGVVTIQYVWGAALSLVFLVLLVNLVAFQYARGVVRGALDEGVRAGSRATIATDECRVRALQVLDQLLAGPLGDDVTVACERQGEVVVATARGTLRSWIPLVPDHRFSMRAVAVKELP